VSRRRLIAVVPLSALGAVVLAACGAPATPASPTAGTSAAPTTAAPPTAAAAPTLAPTATAAPAAPTVAPTAVPTTAPATIAPPTPTQAAAAATDMATDQTLRLVTGPYGFEAGIEPAVVNGDLRIMIENYFMPPFILNNKGELLPGVCNKWEVSDDALKYTLHVDPAAKFSDGSPVTAGDIKFSWERGSDPNLKNGWGGSYVSSAIDGYDDYVNGKAKEMKGLVAQDDQTLVVSLAHPYTPFIKSTATWLAGVLSKKNVTSAPDWDAHPVCVGPYMVTSWDRNTFEITWQPNPHWWGEKPIIQKITHKPIKDPTTQSISYDNNEADIYNPSDAITAQLKSNASAKDQLLSIPYGGEYFYYFATNRKPADDPKIRLALLKATNMGDVVKAVYKGGQDPAYGILSWNLDGYSDPKTYYDPEGAKAALAQSSYKTAANVPPITIGVKNSLPEFIQISEAMQQMWKTTLGLDVSVLPYDKSADPNSGPLKAVQVFRSSLGTIINDPSASISAMGWSKSSVVKGEGNFADSKLDEMITTADALPLNKEADRVKLYLQAEQYMLTQAYYIPIIWVHYFYMVKPWVKNAAVNNDNCFYSIARMYLAKH
jgi:ABC-type oligopeptide transport system substrate-binding subunit